MNYAKEQIPGLSLTSDIIVGFPGETYEDFCDTVSLIREVKFSSLFTFIYSPREGTPAAAMEDPVTRAEKGKWFAELLAAQEKIAAENEQKLIGTSHRLLCDAKGTVDGYMSGHSEGTAVVEFPGDESMIDKFINVRIEECDGVFKGKIITEE